VLLGGLGLLLLVSLAAALLSARQQASQAPTPTPAAAPLIAHGQIVPATVARVGTQGGGVVQQLGPSLGAEVAAQTPLAWVSGPNGTEIVTAPFSGTLTNVLVHAGDTLAPGAPIAVVADMHSLQVETSDVDEFLVSHVRVGQSVPITIDALDNAMVTGTVTNVALLPQTMAGTNSQAYPVIVRLNGLPAAARAGMSVRLTFPD
jgi:biotin carboxyl carrier protein